MGRLAIVRGVFRDFLALLRLGALRLHPRVPAGRGSGAPPPRPSPEGAVREPAAAACAQPWAENFPQEEEKPARRFFATALFTPWRPARGRKPRARACVCAGMLKKTVRATTLSKRPWDQHPCSGSPKHEETLQRRLKRFFTCRPLLTTVDYNYHQRKQADVRSMDF